MIRLLSRHHPAASPSPPLPLCPAARQRGTGGERGGKGLAEAQLLHVFQDGVSPFAPDFGYVAKRTLPEVNDMKKIGDIRFAVMCPYCTLQVSK